jgi:hypothetical protein
VTAEPDFETLRAELLRRRAADEPIAAEEWARYQALAEAALAKEGRAA